MDTLLVTPVAQIVRWCSHVCTFLKLFFQILNLASAVKCFAKARALVARKDAMTALSSFYARSWANGVSRYFSCPLVVALGGSSSRSQAGTSRPCLIPRRVISMLLQVARESSQRCVTVQGGIPFEQHKSSGVCHMRHLTRGIRCSTLLHLESVPSKRSRVLPG